MLEDKVFAKSVQRLGDYYPKFELTKSQMETWYHYFKKYSYNEFMKMIQLYIDQNEFPPQSPRSLTKYYEEALRINFERKYMSPDEAWQVARQGIRMFPLHYEHYKGKELYEWLGQFTPILAKTVEQHEAELAVMNEADTFIGNSFKRSYQALLDWEVNESVCTHMKHTQIGFDKTELLESNG